MKTAKVGNFEIGGPEFTLIGGPCVAESREICFEIASFLKDLCASRGVSYIFKASFDKATAWNTDLKFFRRSNPN